MGFEVILSLDFHSSSLKILSIHMKSLAFLRVNYFSGTCLTIAHESSGCCRVTADRSGWIPIKARYRYLCGWTHASLVVPPSLLLAGTEILCWALRRREKHLGLL